MSAPPLHLPGQLAAADGTGALLLDMAGVALVALLLAAFMWGRRHRAREPGPPRPGEQPRLPEGGPVGDVMESRETRELARTEQRRSPRGLKEEDEGHGRTPSR
ncbi:DUF6479 family protein [Streptomyces sp. NPDC048611]|uniref:DUF6479 family protein n=1 Tax=Streptomyces sp. NPDC048611 TaxID=3155635 RepID=UPI003420AD24